MEFKASRTNELFEAAAARGDREALMLQMIVAQISLIALLPISLKDKERLSDGLRLIIEGLSPNFMEKHMKAALKVAGALDADRRDHIAGLRG